jgi:hypothetical protein
MVREQGSNARFSQMATSRKTASVTPAAPKADAAPAEAPRNMQSWRDLLNGTGKDAILVQNDATNAIAEAFREIGYRQDEVERATSGLAVIRAAEHAFQSIASNGIELPDDKLIAVVGLADFKPKSQAEKQLHAELKDLQTFVEQQMLRPAVSGWIEQQEARKPGFKARALMSRKDCEAAGGEFKNARQQADNHKMEVARSIYFGPVLGPMRMAASKDGSVYKYGSQPGFRKMCTDLREVVSGPMRTGILPKVDEVTDWVWTHMEDVIEQKAKPENDAAIQAAFKKVADAVTAFSKFLNDAKDATGDKNHGVDQRHVDVWVSIRGELGGMSKFPFDLVHKAKLVKAKTDEEKAADAKAAEDAKVAALNEQDAAEQE